ncbi:N-acetyltransferase [Thalassospira sp. MA62]|nr:N-acetyltransferase [Thalassospira sp. MA62]
MQIREEAEKDFNATHALLASAFETAPQSWQTEHLIVDALRKKGKLTLSLIAEEDNQLVGCASFSPIKINGTKCDWYGLGPVAVFPSRQGLGIGSELIQSGIHRLRDAGAKGCVALGDRDFHSRFGFEPYVDLYMKDVPTDMILALPFTDETPCGEVQYDSAFYILPEKS